MTTANSVTSEDTTTTEGVGDSKVESSDTRQAEAKVDADSPTTLSSGCGDADQPSPPNVTANADESNEAEVTATSNTNEKTNPIPDTAKSIVASESAATDSVSNDDGAVKEKNGESNSAPTLGTTVSESGGSETEPTRKRKMSRWGAPPKKKRKNRWGNKKPASALSNLMQLNGGLAANTAMASAMFGTKEWDEKQTKIMILRQKLQEVSTRLIAPAAFAATMNQAEAERSPSPEPVYDSKGIRINTREHRMKEKLKKQRIEIIQQLLQIDPNYQAPSDYKPPKLTAKITMPVEEYPDYNFFGLIVGPRGNTQKEMQTKTGCKIAVRGQGASDMDKPGRMVHPDDNEPLHVHITAPNQESLDKATTLINNLIEEVKNGGVEHKAAQLRQLAAINGTLRIETRCRICGGQHPIYRCPEKTGEKWTPADVQCAICGELTHVTEDCKHFKRGRNGQHVGPMPQKQSIDQEYANFMAELVGDAPSSSYSKPVAAITGPTTAATSNGNVPSSTPASATVIGSSTTDGTHTATTITTTDGKKTEITYHSVPPPHQKDAKPPTQVNADGNVAPSAQSAVNKNVNVNGQTANGNSTGVQNGNPLPTVPPVMNRMPQMRMPMYPPMGMPPMMPPNPYAMGMPPMAPGYPMMPMNPYMPRPPMMPNYPMRPPFVPQPPGPPPQ